MQANILILTHWSFKDALIQTYTLPYVEQIRKVLPVNYSITIVTSEQERLALNQPAVDAINREWRQKNMRLLAFPYKRFGLKKLVASVSELVHLLQLVKREKIEVIHAFCTPAGSIGYLLSKLTGARLVVDSYEPHAEAMVENNTWKSNSAAYRLLHQLERWQTKRAVSLIATSHGMKQYAKKQFGVDVRCFHVKPACVDLEKFSPREKNAKLLQELGLEGKVICVYAGKLGGIYLREEVFDFIKCCYDFWGDAFRFVMLTNATKEEIDTEIARVGLPQLAVISRFVLHDEVPAYLSLGDFSINPVKPVPTKRYCTSIKDGEYWAMGLPVVITPNISDDSGIIAQHEIGYVLQHLSEPEYRNAVRRIAELLQQDRQALQQKIRAVAEQYRNFCIAEEIYTSLYNN
jgi:glycosyltransferase involved in cell wall biosynthesis